MTVYSFSGRLLALPLSLHLALSPLALAGEQVIECASRHDRYQYCSVDTDGYVRLDRQLSRSPCIEDRTWGYDDDGVWVDEGCRARFAVGYGYDDDYDDDYNNDYDDDDDKDIDGKDLATAAVVIGGIALLGALLGDQNSAQPAPDYPPNYPTDPYPQQPPYLPQTPAWAVGTFRGYDAFYRTQLELTIAPNGVVSGYADGNPVSGSFQNNELRIRDMAFAVQPEGDGLSAVQRGNDSNRVRYHRLR